MRNRTQKSGGDTIRDGRNGRMAINRHFEFLEDVPYWLVALMEERRVFVDGRQDNSAQARFLCPSDFTNCLIDIIKFNKRHPNEPLRRRLAEIRQPPIVCAIPDFNLFGSPRNPERFDSEFEWNTEIWKDHLGSN